MVKLLLGFIKDVEKKTPDGFTAMMMALAEDDFVTADLLQAAGADINNRYTSISGNPY